MMEMTIADLAAQIGFIPTLAIALALGFIFFRLFKRLAVTGNIESAQSGQVLPQPVSPAPVSGVHPGHIAAISAALSQYQNETQE